MRKIVLYLISIIVIILTAFVFSCTKNETNDLVTNQKNSVIYDIEGLMKEKIVIEMLNALKPYNFQVNNHGIFEFKKIEDLNAVLDILSRYSNELDDPKNIYPNDPVLFAFEYHYRFNSLRYSIDQEVLRLEKNDELTEFNDPDNNNIVGDEFRSILTTNKELIVGDIICVYLDSVTVGIHNFNYEMLNQVHMNYARSGVSGIAELCLANDVVTLDNGERFEGEDINFVIDIYYTNINHDALTYQFTPIVNYTNVNPNHFSYYWQFDDGSTSTEREPTHIFPTSGEYDVKLTVFYGGGGICTNKNIMVGTCNSNFTYITDQNVVGKYYFTNTSSVVVGNITSYDWYFGDNTAHINTQNASHAYSADGDYTVKLVITTDQGCSDTYESEIKVSGVGDCCVMYDKEVNKTVTYASGTRQLKLVIKVVNVWPLHGYASKTINYRIKNNGSLALEKADKIKTNIAGLVYSTDCSSSNVVDNGEVKENKNKATYSYYQTHSPIRVRKNSLYSTYYVKDNGDAISGTALSLHQKNCN
ncbi:MAG: PKD domain-containing protein [Bacteroidales bacterium]|nr:PKD domain-containing protein [Bacteroidales bacterium]MDD3858764.1 PKD domain-containing protein [Bacteroidales bacterium]